MYSCQAKIRILFIFCLISIFCARNCTLGFDLTNEISSFLSKWSSDSYSEKVYQANYPKDPFNDALEGIENMSMQVKMAGVDYVEKALKENGCSLSRKKIQSILYYYVKDFRADLMKNLKEGLGEYDSSKFVLDKEKVSSYCKDVFYCNEYNNRSSFKDYKDQVTSSTPANSDSWCKEYFVKKYEEGQENQQNKQNVEVSWLGSDKYRNSTIDDSPYDILVDFGNVGKILYTDVQEPVTPVFFNLPVFSNSKKSLESRQNGENSDNNPGKSDSNGSINSQSINNNPLENTDKNQGETQTVVPNGNEGNDSKGNGNGFSSSTPEPLSLSDDIGGFVDESIYDDLLEGLGSRRINQSNSLYYGSLCEPTEEEPEPITNTVSNVPSLLEIDEDFDYDYSDVSEQEFEELVDYLKGAVDKYTALPEEKKEEIAKKAGDTSSFVNDTTPSEIEATANRIKNCYTSCEGLRADQYASCVIMCTCGEIDSPIFNPETTPGLGPIFKIRFCAVPGVDNKFSIGGKRIISIQEGVKEIYGVVDKLSREGKLGMWTQQYNFLDSTTKKQNVANTVAFSIDIEFVDISDKEPEHSQQYEEKQAEVRNQSWQTAYRIANDLNNPVLKNRYRVVNKDGDIATDFSAGANADWAVQSESNLKVSQSPTSNQVKNSDSSRYNGLSQILSRWLDQQGNLWVQTYGYINLLEDDAKLLYAKKG